ncbi:MAG: potassium channel protein [Campylobacter sp.]|nr:potassium channel protein [Campylobacter sp.]
MSFTQKLRKFLGWSGSSKPDINADLEIYRQLRNFRFPLILVVLTMMIGTLGFIIFSGFSILDAFYQAGMTFTTVGYSEVAEITPSGRVFAVFFMFLGFGVFTFSIGVVIEVLRRGKFIAAIKEKSMIYKVARLKNHFVVCYHNDYTIALSKQFRQNHIPFVVIDSSENFEEMALEHKYPYFIKGEPHTESSLLKAHLSSAKGVISLSPNIADNIALIATVRLYEKELELSRKYFIMTTATKELDTDRLKKLGADFVILPSKLTAQRLSAISVRPDMENILDKFLYKKDSSLDIEEIHLPEHSWMRFKRIRDTHMRDITGATIVGLRDEYDKFTPMPNADEVIGSNAKLLVVGTAEGISFVKKLINGRYRPKDFNYV